MAKELEAIRDDKLRIGLLGLKRLFEVNAKKMTKDEIMAFDFTFMNITKALLKAQEQEKALKIIKEKNVDIYWLKVKHSVDQYNIWAYKDELTQEEFDLLKRWAK